MKRRSFIKSMAVGFALVAAELRMASADIPLTDELGEDDTVKISGEFKYRVVHKGHSYMSTAATPTA